MARVRVKTLASAAALVGVVALAGCGGSSSASSSAKTTATSAAQPATTAKAKTTPASSAAKKTASVAIKDFEYVPAKDTVTQGAKVTWTNMDTANHTVTFDKGSMKDLGSVSKGDKVSFTFSKKGTFAYHCDFHPNMHGTIVVR